MSQDKILIVLNPREVTGKKVKHIRNEGTVPAVIHDHGKDSIVVEGNAVELHKVYKEAGKHHPVQVKVGSKEYMTLIKEVTFSPRNRRMTHVVFNAVAKDQKVEAEIPVHAKYAEGNEASPAERAGLLVLGSVESVMVEALPNDLPDVLYYDAEKLVSEGDHVIVADLIVPANVVVQDEPTQTIATVFEPSAIAAANDAAGGTEEESEEASESAEAATEAKEE